MAIKIAKALAKAMLEDEPQDMGVASVAPSKPKVPLKKVSEVNDTLKLKSEFCLITELHKTMGRYDKDRPYHRLHASDVTKDNPVFCPRERALLIETKSKPNEKYISTETRTYFDIGEAYHDIIREDWGRPVSYGDWLCLSCDHVHLSMHHPVACNKCKSFSIKYQEQRVLSADTGISCGIDWQVKKGSLPIAIAVEIKSINPAEFKKLHAPLAEHRIRTQLYLQSIATATDKKAVSHLRKDMALILYVTKGAPDDGEYVGGAGFVEKRTPFKQFTVTRDDEAISEYLYRGRQFSEYRDTGTLPERICPNPISTRAKKCSQCQNCWSKA